jgi:tetratricopeptide (TPR) repeat protein/pimeloyl-ACP methyl ester carboxylesterase
MGRDGMAELQRLHQGRADRPAVIFIHGLGGHPIDTWRHADCAADDCWPHWIGRDADCDTWVLGYDAALSAWREQAMPLPDQGDQVADLLATRSELAARSLVLVGHSMGGLVIKTVIADAGSKGDRRIATLVDRIRGVVFIASPHAGSQLANLARVAGFALRTNVQVGNMQAHDPHLRQLNQRFRAVAAERRLEARVFAEARGVFVGRRLLGLRFGPQVMVVDPNSADPALPGSTPVPLAEDHFSICKPVDPGQQIHRSLCDFLATLSQPPAAEAAKPATQPNPPATPPREPGRLRGSADNRLQARDGRFYGRSTEVVQVLSFLRGQQSAAVVSALVGGLGGIGKTEVCKAALRAWLAERAEAVAYYVNLPDRASVAELIDAIGRALGADAVDSWQQLRPLLRPGLYYLDNLESVVEQADGLDLLRELAAVPELRLLASSRVGLPALFGKPILIDALPDADALRLFRDLWNGTEPLPPDADLQGFVVDRLGAHPLSITLCARLGDCYGYAELQRRWAAQGAAALSDVHDDSRLGSVVVSMRLTAEALAAHPGALDLWTAAAIFVDGVPDALLSQLERAGGWSEARPWLVRHHLLTRRDDAWHVLPPVSRYALDAAARVEDGFDWRVARAPLHALFGAMARDADSIASTQAKLAARRLLLEHFGDLVRLLQRELICAEPDQPWLQATHDSLLAHYQFRAASSRDLLQTLAPALGRPASAWAALGDMENRLGRPDVARALYERALALFEHEHNGMGWANTLRLLGDLESRLGHLDAAHALNARALEWYEQAHCRHGQAHTLFALGSVESDLGRPDAARALYERALDLFEQEQHGLGQASTLWLLGCLESDVGSADKARAWYQRALALYAQEQSGLGQAHTLRSLGVLESRLGRPDAARARYEQALTLYAIEQEPAGAANTWIELARDWHALAHCAERDAAFVQAFGFARRTGVEGLRKHVFAVLVEVTGGDDAAAQWMAGHVPDD